MKPGNHNTIEQRVLRSAAAANAVNLAYKPGPAFAAVASRLADAGCLQRGAFGGWWLTEDGRRRLA